MHIKHVTLQSVRTQALVCNVKTSYEEVTLNLKCHFFGSREMGTHGRITIVLHLVVTGQRIYRPLYVIEYAFEPYCRQALLPLKLIRLGACVDQSIQRANVAFFSKIQGGIH
jgi:hypothetical protein